MHEFIFNTRLANLGRNSRAKIHFIAYFTGRIPKCNLKHLRFLFLCVTRSIKLLRDLEVKATENQ